MGLDEFTRGLYNVFVEAQNSFFCTLDVIRNTQLCMHNFSPIFGNLTEHVNKVRIMYVKIAILVIRSMLSKIII